MTRFRTVLCWIVAATGALSTRASAGGTYVRWAHESIANTCGISGNGHSVPCCTVDGWDWSGDNKLHPACDNMLSVSKVITACSTDRPIATRLECPVVCGCGDAGNPFCGGGIDVTKAPDQSIDAASYACDRNDTGGTPELCDGQSSTPTGPVDQGCGADEFACHVGDSDPAPVRYASGRVEANPITVFSVPTPDGSFFGYRLTYNSEVVRTAAQRNTVNSVHDSFPVIHHSEEDTHYVGLGWLDNFSDRLYVTAPNTPTTRITWMSQDGTVTFTNVNGVWKSWSGRFELIDRGAASADGLGKWLVRSIDPSVPRQIWTFETFQYKPYDGSAAQTLGRLRRRALQGSDSHDVVGRYGVTLSWTEKGTIATAIDTLGRAFDFVYRDQTECTKYAPNKQPPDDCLVTEVVTTRLVGVRYRPSSSTSAVDVVALEPTPFPENDRLERVSSPGAPSYKRFLYQIVPPGAACVHCNALLTDVILPGEVSAATPGVLAPVQPGEIVSEHDDYGPGSNPNLMSAVHSSAPGREYAYEYTVGQTMQFDLHQDGGPCGSGNSCSLAGYACHAVNQVAPHCYAADVITHDYSSGLSTSHVPAGASSPQGVGASDSFSMSYQTNGAPRGRTDPSGGITSYGYDSLGRLRCIVHNDSDNQAFAVPAHPDSSACAGPTTSKVEQTDYTATSVTTTSSGMLGVTVTDAEIKDPDSRLTIAHTMTGATRDLDGNFHTESHTTQFGYDALGRPTLIDGPLDNDVAYDVTATTYYSATDAVSPYDISQISSVTRYAGTATSKLALVTRYQDYDLYGVPHKVVAPNGVQTVFSASADRLVWTSTVIGDDGVALAPTVVTLDPLGTVRSERSADGVCVTYEYVDTTGFVGMPTVIRRSNTNCGVRPIDQNSDEVEIRQYMHGEADRLQSVTRKTNGVVEVSYSGFAYDRDRRMIASPGVGTSSQFTYQFTNVMPTGVTSPGGPGPGAWKSTVQSDALGRPSQVARYLDASNRTTYTYAYASINHLQPTQITRGLNGGATSVSNFVYDDFGRLLEAVVPEAGAPGNPTATRYEYDVAGRLSRERSGQGGPAAQTTRYAYDSLDRVVAVDHDLEHPVDCATAAAGTPIQDEEYAYDQCAAEDSPPGFSCGNAIGQLVMSRAIVQCGSGGAPVKRGRWYRYDHVGRVAAIGYASAVGSVIEPAQVADYAYDAFDRLLRSGSPVNDSYGTQYSYRAVDGRVAGLSTNGDGTRIADSINYRAFGSVVELSTASVQSSSSGDRALGWHDAYRTDDRLASTTRSYTGAGATTLALLDQQYSYNPAGVVTGKTDAAEPTASRHYGYDALLRLICEVRDGDATDCVATSGKLAALYSYGTGATAAQPMDVRTSSFVHRPSSYQSTATEAYQYVLGSSQLQAISRGDGNIVFGYDSLGRRTSDMQQPVDRRDYRYLPNGRLGSVSGTDANGAPYSISIRYDAEGRPVTLSHSDGTLHELFWDDSNRLSAAIVQGAHEVRWSYHYLGDRLVAATREVVGPTTDVKRFWFVGDEHRLITRVVDEVGATYWQARWDAPGWRTLEGHAAGRYVDSVWLAGADPARRQ